MPVIDGLTGLNTSGGTNVLLAAYGNDIVNVSAGTGYGQNLTAGQNAEFEQFLDRAFFQNYTQVPKTFDGTSWTRTHVGRCLRSRYIKKFKDRLYLGYCRFTAPGHPNNASGSAITFPSRVFYSDLFNGQNLTWGTEWGTNGKTAASSPYFELDQPIYQSFTGNNIKVGDPLFITSGNTQLQEKSYTVASIESPYRLKITENFPVTATSLHFWVGSNWLAISEDDGNVVTGLGENSDRLLIFKEDSLWRYDQTSLRQVKGVPGTTSHRSVVNIGDYTYDFHRTGIWRYNGVSSTLISRPVQKYIDGIAGGFYDNVVAWPAGDNQQIYRCYVDTVSNTAENLSVSRCIVDYDTSTQTWSPGTMNNVANCKTFYIESGAKNVYIGDDSEEVFQIDSGNSDDTVAIPWFIDTGFHFPAGSDIEIEFTRVLVYSRNGRGLPIKYKLYGTPFNVDKQWRGLGNIDDEVTEFKFDPGQPRIARGIALSVMESSTSAPPVIEKIDVFYKAKSGRSI